MLTLPLVNPVQSVTLTRSPAARTISLGVVAVAFADAPNAIRETLEKDTRLPAESR